MVVWSCAIEQVEFVIWATPAGGKARTLLKSMSAELARWKLPCVHVLPPKHRRGAARQRQQQRGEPAPPLRLAAGKINIVAHDDMRLMQDLPTLGMRSVVVFDEVDQL